MTLDMKKWLKLQEQEAARKQNDPNSYVQDGIEYNIEMSQKFADEWFFKLVNGNWANIVPGLCMDSAVYALAIDCIINMRLSGWSTEDIIDMVTESVKQAEDMKAEWEDDEDNKE
jgi:hypothetical protein